MPKKFLTVNDVARLLGVTPLTVRNWNPVNNYRLYKIEEVEALLKQIERSKEVFTPVKINIETED